MPTIQIAIYRDGKNVREPVEAEMFTVDGLELAMHERRDYVGLWSVTEPQTGYAIGNNEPTREEAIAQATKRVRKTGIEKVKQLIAEVLAKNKPSEPEPKGELVGTTAEELHAQVCRERGWRWEWTKRDLQVALAAQRAMAEELDKHRVDVENTDAFGVLMGDDLYINRDDWIAIKSKLGVE